MTEAVLDASALLALLAGEPRSHLVEEALTRGDCAISAVNVSEVAAKLAERGAAEGEIRAALGALHLDIRAFGLDEALAAGMLRPATRSLGLSLGDRACIALGQSLSVRVLTTDRLWASFDAGVEIQVAQAP